MQRRRLGILAVAVATIGVAMLGNPRSAKADILVTVAAGGTTMTFDSGSSNNTSFATGSFTIGGANGYTGEVNTVTTNYPGAQISGISTTINVTSSLGTPTNLMVTVQLVNDTPTPPTNLLWTAPSGNPVSVSAGSTFAPQTGVTAGSITSSAYFNSTASTTTTGLTGTGPTSTTTMPAGTPGLNAVTMANSAGSYTLSQTLLLTGLNAGVPPINFGGTVSVSAITPEPSTMAIAGIGALGMIGFGLRRRKVLGG